MICYIILTFSAIRVRNIVISPSKIMYHDSFQKEKNYDFFETIAIQTIYAYILNVNFIYAF